ncbi:MAG TPA: hypothetical protein VGO90_15760 [Chthoniobacteraceae bacterium]|jgi:hypothetical protein|nr:hypothetical protein [Chthoniobacteraceae bacterium]
MRSFSLALLSLAALVVSASAAPVDLGSVAGYTPYDRYIRPVKQVLSTLGNQKASLEQVHALMREGRSFRYAHTDPYNAAPPAVTEARKVGDCKDKALWLCDQLGDSSARFVIGKMKRSSSISHAWVMWENQGRWWVLDCTLNSRPIPVEKVGNGDYVPLYSYAKSGTYRHARASLRVASVAARQNAPVAAR